MLADSLRSSRLTVLYAGAGASRSELLQRAVAPSVGRRVTDAAGIEILAGPAVAPSIDRRAANACAERAIYFRVGDGDPLDGLFAAVAAVCPSASAAAGAPSAFVDLLRSATTLQPVRLLIVVDSVERLWLPGADRVGTSSFIDALGVALEHVDVPANFLLAIDDRFEAQMESLRRVAPRFDDSTVRLLGFEAGSPPSLGEEGGTAGSEEAATNGDPRVSVLAAPERLPILSEAVTGPPPATARARRPGSARRPKAEKQAVLVAPPIKTDGVYAFIESTLAQTAAPAAPWGASAGQASGPADATRTVRPASGAKLPQTPSDIVRMRATGNAEGSSFGDPDSPIDHWLDVLAAWWHRLRNPR